MALTKRTYVDGETVITAANLNDIQDEIIRQEEAKVDKVSGKGLSTNDFTNALKTKLDDLTIDSTLSETSTNPVQNKAVKGAIDSVLEDTLSGISFSITHDYGEDGILRASWEE